MHYFVNTARRDINVFCQFILADFKWFEKFLHKNFSRMNRLYLFLSHINDLLMIINYFHIISIIFRPAEANTPLVVDADAMLAYAVAEEFFQPVSRWNAQILCFFCCIKQKQLSKGVALNICRQFSRMLS